MNETEFNQLINETLQNIETLVEKTYPDIDVDYENEILTLSLKSGERLILTRQAALQQLWLAAKRTGYHFNYSHSQWQCDKTNRSLDEVLNELLKNS